jgi:hypothetical protein
MRETPSVTDPTLNAATWKELATHELALSGSGPTPA